MSTCAHCLQIATHTGEGEDVCYGHVYPDAADEYTPLTPDPGPGPGSDGLSAAELADLRYRILRAMLVLEEAAQASDVRTTTLHLLSKRQGVALVLDYLRAYGGRLGGPDAL